jgi:23S rRNA (cytidine2498-2'-O)-methyltransferase
MPAPDSMKLFLLVSPSELELAREEWRRSCKTPPIAITPTLWQFVGTEDLALLAFHRQALISPQTVTADSISKWAALLAEKIILTIPTSDPWHLHIFTLSKDQEPIIANRCKLITRSLLDELKENSPQHHAALSKATPSFFNTKSWLVQLLLDEPGNTWLSISSPTLCAKHAHLLSPFPGDIIEIPDDRGPPSRAFKKLLEAEARVGQTIKAGERVIDLGASPGGWSAIALARGAQLTAIDRSPLTPELMRNPNLTFKKGDAFNYGIKDPIDWLLCDVIAAPERSWNYVAPLLTHKLVKNLVLTLKFQGPPDWVVLQKIQEFQQQNRGTSMLLKRMNANKNEVMFLYALEALSKQ